MTPANGARTTGAIRQRRCRGDGALRLLEVAFGFSALAGGVLDVARRRDALIEQ